MSDEHVKHAGGRPTKYKPEYCEEIIQYMRDGKSLAEFAAHINVARDTVNEWANVHPEFSAAKKHAIELSEAWWTSQGRIALREREFNHVLWYMNMKNRFGWRDKQEIEMDNKIHIHIDADDARV